MRDRQQRRNATTRREFLSRASASAGALALGLRGAAAQAQAEDSWRRGPVRHLLPMVDHRRIRLKASFVEAMPQAPALRIGRHFVAGQQTDSAGRFWQFDTRQLDETLEPSTEYDLQLVRGGGRRITDPWPLRTFPAPDVSVEQVRVAVYTCAGGSDSSSRGGRRIFNSLAQRQRLFARLLSFRPDVVVGVGDHIYWDQQTGILRAPQDPSRREEYQRIVEEVGLFDRGRAVLGTVNEEVFLRVGDAQIAALYGVLFRSTPIFLTQDDHDYFEDDRTLDDVISFPPDPFMLRLARASHRLYYPEFLPDPTRPRGLDSFVWDERAGIGESYGTLRYGALLEALLFDCRRHLTLKGPLAGFISDPGESWIRRRMANSSAAHVVAMPSAPIGWTAGKWGEWYPDLAQSDGSFGIRREKPYWQQGWFEQHQRLLAASSGMSRLPLWVSGDLHALGATKIERSLALDLRANPVHSILAGPVSTADLAWPSTNRGTAGETPQYLISDDSLAPLERNGFTLLDFHRDGVEVRQFGVDLTDESIAVETLEPLHRMRLSRRLV